MASIGSPGSWKANIESSNDLLFAAETAKIVRSTLSTATRRGPQKELWEAVQPNISTLLENEHSLHILESLIRYGTPRTVSELCDALGRLNPAVLPTLAHSKHGCHLVAAAVTRIDAMGSVNDHKSSEVTKKPNGKKSKSTPSQSTASGRSLFLSGLLDILTAEAFIEHGAIRTICTAVINNEELASSISKTVFLNTAVKEFLVKEMTECIAVVAMKFEQKQKKAASKKTDDTGNKNATVSKKIPDVISKMVGMQRNCVAACCEPITDIIFTAVSAHAQQLFSSVSMTTTLTPLTVLLTAVAEAGSKSVLNKVVALMKKHLLEGSSVLRFTLQQHRTVAAIFQRSDAHTKEDFSAWFFATMQSHVSTLLESFDGSSVLMAARESGVLQDDDKLKPIMDAAEQRVKQRTLGVVAATADAILRRKREREEQPEGSVVNKGPSCWGNHSKLSNTLPLLEIPDSDDDKPAVAAQITKSRKIARKK